MDGAQRDDEDEDDDGNKIVRPSIKIERNLVDDPIDEPEPINALVRIRIPKVKPEFELDDEGNPIVEEYNEDDLEEIPFVDQCAAIETVSQDKRIWVINQ